MTGLSGDLELGKVRRVSLQPGTGTPGKRQRVQRPRKAILDCRMQVLVANADRAKLHPPINERAEMVLQARSEDANKRSQNKDTQCLPP